MSVILNINKIQEKSAQNPYIRVFEKPSGQADPLRELIGKSKIK